MATLYHGTTIENFEQIIESGELIGPVYFSATLDKAAEYALSNDPNGVVIAVDFDGDLMPDNESLYWDSADEAIENGAEVYTNCNVSVADATFTFYEDYEPA